MKRIGIAALGALLTTVSPAQQPAPFALEFSHGSERGAWVVPAGGWPLEVVVRPRKILELGASGITWGRSRDGWRVVFVTRDPDGCPSWLQPGLRGPRAAGSPDAGRCALSFQEPWPEDEEQLEVFPGSGPLGGAESKPDPDSSGCPGSPRIAAYELFDDGSGGANTLAFPVGPCVGSGEGYGAHPRLPGLVLLADRGPGVFFPEPTIQVPKRRRARNLAGFFDSVGLMWRDAESERRVSAHMAVPRGLFSSIVSRDTDVSRLGPWGSCRRLRALDGGEPFCDELPVLDLGTELRAFLVVGEAPAELVDADGDGRIDASDAEAAGFVMYSDEAVMRVREHRGETIVDVDLDGDGRAATYPVPMSPVEITDPPP